MIQNILNFVQAAAKFFKALGEILIGIEALKKAFDALREWWNAPSAPVPQPA